MAYQTSASTTTLLAKLTPSGRKKLVSSNTALITSFSLGDSDANYNCAIALDSGTVPSVGGNIGAETAYSNSVCSNVTLRSKLIVDASGTLLKSVEPQSSIISSDIVSLGRVTLSGNQMTQYKVERQNQSSDPLVNLFYTFGLPCDAASLTHFTGTTFANGGLSNTALSSLSNGTIAIISIDNAYYGELIDGKSVSVTIDTVLGSRTLYSTFENKGTSTITEDATFVETSETAATIGDNIAFLFCDAIKTPNGQETSSWGVGINNFKPFSQNNKQLFNMVTDSNVGHVADTAVGVVYLDKGLIVITHPQIANNYFPYTHSASTVVNYSSVATAVSQNITCIAGRGEFGFSNNNTFTITDVPRITEIGLYDAEGDLIAIAKSDRHIIKPVNQFLSFGVKITL